MRVVDVSNGSSCCSVSRENIFFYIKSVLLLVTFMILLCVIGRPALARETVRIATLDWPPYISKSLSGEGCIAEVIREAYKRNGYDVRFLFMPWERAIKNVAEGTYDGLTPIYYTKERTKVFIYSDQILASPFVFAKRKSDRVEYNSLDDLRPYKIATCRGWAYTEEFDNAEFLQKSYTNNELTGYRRLLKGSVDLWLVDKFTGQYLISSHQPERAGEIEFLPKPLAVENLYVTFPKIEAQSQKMVKALNQGLGEILKDGTIQKILERHGLSLD